jgi:hypothetical protein
MLVVAALYWPFNNQTAVVASGKEPHLGGVTARAENDGQTESNEYAETCKENKLLRY